MIRARDTASPAGGILRGTRRPPDFVARGPAPQPPTDLSGLWPGPNEDLCWLAGDWRILQRIDGHRFSLDDLVTAYVAVSELRSQPPRRFLDLGCGIGSVLMFVGWTFPDVIATGIEAQTLSAAMARRSVQWNGAQDRITVLDGDLRTSSDLATRGPFDLITGTPPYFPPGTGLQSDQVQRGPCRFEHRGGPEDYAAAAAPLLAPGAPFVMCASAKQLDRIPGAASAAGLQIEKQMDIIPRAGEPVLFSTFVLRAPYAAAPFVQLPPLCARDIHGHRSEALKAVRIAMGMPG